MLYNIELNKVQKTKHCLTCKHFDRKYKKCNGLGKNCFPYDPKTRVVVDPITKLPIKIG